MAEVEVPRDGWGRPKILQADGSLRAYTRVSTMAKTLDDTSALGRWFRRETLKGAVKRPDLLALAGTAVNDNRKLDDICEQAMEAAGSSSAANLGTALHTITEQIDAGAEAVTVPPQYGADIAAYMSARDQLELKPHSAEQFVVVDALETAGSFDRLWKHPDGSLIVGDLKTGKAVPDYPHAVAIQLALYAHGQLYDPATGARTALPDGTRTDVGYLIHMPAGRGVCRFYEMDLTVGWHWAHQAAATRSWRKDKSFIKPIEGRVLTHV